MNASTQRLFINLSTSALLVFVVTVLLRLAGSPSEDNAVGPALDSSVDYLIGWLWAALLSFLVLLLPLGDREKVVLFALWFLKVLVALGLMLVYEASYGLDSWSFFFQAVTGSDYLPLEGNIGVISSIEFLLKFHPASFHAIKVSMAFLGLAGVYCFYRAIVLYIEREDLRILVFLALFPSILFWSSILGKDPLNFLGVGLYALGAIGLMKTGRFSYFCLLIAGVALAFWIRTWNVFIMIVPLVIVSLWNLRDLIRVGSFVLVLAGVGVFFQTEVSEWVGRITAMSLAEQLLTIDAVGKAFAEEGSSIGPPPELSSVSSVLLHMPSAVAGMLFRPLPGEVLNVFGILAGLENVVLLVLLVQAIRGFSRRKLDKSTCWAILYVILWAAVHGVVIKNYGTAMRFRLQILPILLALLVYFGYWKVPSWTNERRTGDPS